VIRFIAMFLLAAMSSLATAATTGSGAARSSDVTETTDVMTLYQQATASWPSCGYWHPSGICFFLVCGLYECHIETSERYSMMLPDLVVSSYHDLDNHPYETVGPVLERATLSSLSWLYKQMIGDSAGTRYKKKRSDKNIKFRDGDAIGHPGGMFTASYLCKSAAQAGTLYFSSFSDFMGWRDFLPVDFFYPETWVPGMRETGSWPLNTWGNVYPRSGWLAHQHEVKNAAVLSQRMADIVTRTTKEHVFQELSSAKISQRDGQTVFDPPSAIENNMIGGIWQTSAPHVGPPPSYCHVFGLNDTATPGAFGDFQTSKTSSYAFSLWRPYACCDTQGIFLYAVVWGMW
jgi:integrating conjugative element protein (TIGR03756 family)